MNNACRAAIVTAVLAAAPATANASVIGYYVGTGAGGENAIRYSADGHERNRLTIATRTNSVTLIDPGARMFHDHSGCKISRDRHRARCPYDGEVFLIDLGDRGDSLRFTGEDAGRLGRAPRTEVSHTVRLVERYLSTEGFLERVNVKGGSGNDVIHGTRGTDFVDAGSGRDVVDTGDDDDLIYAVPDGRPDTVRGGRGVDTIDGRGEAPMTIDLRARTLAFSDDEDDVDSFDSVERAHGGEGDDVLRGTSHADGLAGDGGADVVDGLAGKDYVAGDRPPLSAFVGNVGAPGTDQIRGGAGDDIVDGRESAPSGQATRTPTDRLACGAGNDRILAREDDLIEGDCERSGQGDFGSFLFQTFSFGQPSLTQPVARAADGAPTYEIGCADLGFRRKPPCTGRLKLETPPTAGADAPSPTILGSGQFTIPSGARQDVAVTLNDAGKAALAAPRAQISVHVLMDSPYSFAQTDFGWQQILSP